MAAWRSFVNPPCFNEKGLCIIAAMKSDWLDGERRKKVWSHQKSINLINRLKSWPEWMNKAWTVSFTGERRWNAKNLNGQSWWNLWSLVLTISLGSSKNFSASIVTEMIFWSFSWRKRWNRVVPTLFDPKIWRAYWCSCFTCGKYSLHQS